VLDHQAGLRRRLRHRLRRELLTAGRPGHGIPARRHVDRSAITLAGDLDLAALRLDPRAFAAAGDTGTGIDDAGFGMRRGDDERPIIRLAADVDDGRAFIDEYFRAARLLLGSNLRPGIHETDGRIVADFEAAGIGEGDDRRAVATGAQTLAILQR